MKTLTQNELVAVNGGFEPLSLPPSPVDWALEMLLDQLRRQAEQEQQEFLAQQTMAD